MDTDTNSYSWNSLDSYPYSYYWCYMDTDTNSYTRNSLDSYPYTHQCAYLDTYSCCYCNTFELGIFCRWSISDAYTKTSCYLDAYSNSKTCSYLDAYTNSYSIASWRSRI